MRVVIAEGMKTLAWRFLAAVALLLGLIGVLLPVIPTVPFLIVAAWAARRGWPALEARLMLHPVFGPQLRDWHQRGAVPRRAKWLATLMLSCSAIFIALIPLVLWLKGTIWTVFLIVIVWLWRRPE